MPKGVSLTPRTFAALITGLLAAALLLLISLAAAAGQDRPDQEDLLTPKERQWLSASNRPIRIGITVIPVQVLLGKKPGDYRGISIDYIKLMERHLGCKFALRYYQTWNEVMDAAKKKEIDMIFAAQETPERSEYLLFSKPYLELPNMIIVRKNMKGTFTLPMMRGLKVACSKGSAVQEFLREKYSYLDLYPVTDELSGLAEVSFGEVDTMVVELSRASYYIEKAQITNLRVAGNAGLNYELRFASRKDWPILNSILNKGLSSITDQDRERITKKWITVGKETLLASRAFWISLGLGFAVIILVFLGFIVWNRTLKRQVAQRTGQLQEQLAERQRAEEGLRQANETLRATLDAAPVAIIDLDTEGRVKSLWNPAAEKMLGWRREEVLGQFLPTVPEESKEEFAGFRAWVRSGKSIIGKDAVRRRKDGSLIEYSIYAAPEYDADGRVIGNIAVLVDITERKRAEQSLALLSFALNHVHEAAFLADENACFHYVNDESCRILGYTRDELLSLGVADIDPDFPRERWPEHWDDLKAQHSLTFETRHRAKDGSIFPVEVSANYFEYDGQGYNLALARDITARKQMEQALVLREQEYRTLLENIPDLIVRYDLDLRRIYVNPAWEKASGLSAGDVINKPAAPMISTISWVPSSAMRK